MTSLFVAIRLGLLLVAMSKVPKSMGKGANAPVDWSEFNMCPVRVSRFVSMQNNHRQGRNDTLAGWTSFSAQLKDAFAVGQDKQTPDRLSGSESSTSSAILKAVFGTRIGQGLFPLFSFVPEKLFSSAMRDHLSLVQSLHLCNVPDARLRLVTIGENPLPCQRCFFPVRLWPLFRHTQSGRVNMATAGSEGVEGSCLSTAPLQPPWPWSTIMSWPRIPTLFSTTISYCHGEMS